MRHPSGVAESPRLREGDMALFFGRPWFASGVRGDLPSGSGRSRSAGMYRVTQLQRREACNERGKIERGRCRSNEAGEDLDGKFSPPRNLASVLSTRLWR